MDFYCERINNDLFNEPINTISNIFFLFASILTYTFQKRAKVKKIFYLFPILIFCIGLGSFLFHLKPSIITLYLDIIPIFLFSILFIILLNKYELNFSILKNLLFILFYLFLFIFITPILNYKFLNGSEFYFANYIVLTIYTIILFLKKSQNFKLIFFAFILFNISIIFRTIDNLICDILNVGTHSFWHIINAYLLFTLTKINYEKKLFK